MRIYFGNVGFGWRMYGIGYKSKWFLGFSMACNIGKFHSWGVEAK